MFDKESFREKRILVTGAGSGIGRASAIRLSELGADVILVSRQTDRLNETLAQMSEGSHQVISVDVTAFDRYDELFENGTQKGRLDGLLHCAGIARAVPLKAMSVAAVDEIMRTNFYSFVMLAKYFSKKKYSNDHASIVGCSAINAHYPQKCMSIYQASKAAVEAAVQGLAQELYVPRKIRINSMIIGPMATPMAGCDDGDLTAVGSQSDATPNLMGMGDPAKVADMAAFLLNEASDYTTGRSFYVDGGRL